MKKSKGGDSTGVRRGTKGYGWCDTDAEFLKPDFDWRRQRGESYVGMYGTVDHPGVVNPAGDLEGDDGNFLPGRQKTGGRQRGVRNRLSHAFLSDLLEEWTEHGRETLKIARIERPVEFAKMVAGLLPREFELEINTTITEISDYDLSAMLDDVRRRLEAGNAAKLINGRAEPAADREPARLLQATSEAGRTP